MSERKPPSHSTVGPRPSMRRQAICSPSGRSRRPLVSVMALKLPFGYSSSLSPPETAQKAGVSELPPDFTLLQVVPRLETGGAEQTTLDVAATVRAAGGRALVA